jgi:hypothetical protein
MAPTSHAPGAHLCETGGTPGREALSTRGNARNRHVNAGKIGERDD